MPLNLPDKLPAVELLKKENIFVMNQSRAVSQDIRPLQIAVLNLMPVKITTETDLVRLLSNSPLQIELSFMKLRSHTPKHTPIEHMQAFYRDFEIMQREHYDGLIITGAPLEDYAYEDVTYWKEVTTVFDWARTHVTSTLYICWAGFAALYHFYGIQKHRVPAKVFGVFEHYATQPQLPIFRGFDDCFFIPHSRHIELHREEIMDVPGLQIVSESDESGIYMVMDPNGRDFYITGHAEYSPFTLDAEYRRDLGRGLPIHMPENYYGHDDPAELPVVRWRSSGNLLFSNWLNYYVYQETPYDWVVQAKQ